jgi:hypothetical protein
MPEPVVGDLLSDVRARGRGEGNGFWDVYGMGVMWCGSRARGGDGLLKLALDPADEACR